MTKYELFNTEKLGKILVEEIRKKSVYEFENDIKENQINKIEKEITYREKMIDQSNISIKEIGEELRKRGD